MASGGENHTCCSSATKCQKAVELGFVEKQDSVDYLLSYRFPSKVGGWPAWLSLKLLPGIEQLKCRSCGKPCIFLLQIYSPGDDQKLSFHRTLFVFVCRSSGCNLHNSNANFRVYRSQLSRENSFYNFEPPSEYLFEEKPNSFRRPSAGNYNPLCVVCGCLGSKKCARCLNVSYCGKDHQSLDWKKGHKRVCKEKDKPSVISTLCSDCPVDKNLELDGQGNEKLLPNRDDNLDEVAVSKGASSRNYDNLLFPELEIVTDTEELPETKPELSEEEKLKQYSTYMKSNHGQARTDGIELKDLEGMAIAESQDDNVFQQFKERIEHYPDQVLRYHKGGEALWVSGENVPCADDIPDCQCGASRQFEFQVLPQLLSHLKVDCLGESLDWGTLAVFSCRDNCDIGENYSEEFLWKQDISHTIKR